MAKLFQAGSSGTTRCTDNESAPPILSERQPSSSRQEKRRQKSPVPETSRPDRVAESQSSFRGKRRCRRPSTSSRQEKRRQKSPVPATSRPHQTRQEKRRQESPVPATSRPDRVVESQSSFRNKRRCRRPYFEPDRKRKCKPDRRRPKHVTKETKPRPRPVFRDRQEFPYRKPTWYSVKSGHAETKPATEQSDAASEVGPGPVEPDDVGTEPATEQSVAAPEVDDVETEPATEQLDAAPEVGPGPVEPEDVETEPVTEPTFITPRKFVTAAELTPLPHSKIRTTKLHSKRSGDGAVVLTSSPYIEKLRLRQSQKELKTSKCKTAKRSLVPSQPVKKRQRTSASRGRKSQRTKERSGSTFDAGNNDDPNCLYCNEKYSASRAREMWVMCDECNRWAHMECAGMNKNDANFKCDFCAD